MAQPIPNKPCALPSVGDTSSGTCCRRGDSESWEKLKGFFFAKSRKNSEASHQEEVKLPGLSEVKENMVCTDSPGKMRLGCSLVSFWFQQEMSEVDFGRSDNQVYDSQVYGDKKSNPQLWLITSFS